MENMYCLRRNLARTDSIAFLVRSLGVVVRCGIYTLRNNNVGKERELQGIGNIVVSRAPYVMR